ncbi:hypothetical protein K523DRAFT_321673, partial [Schizophyllum commune Tattone D]
MPRGMIPASTTPTLLAQDAVPITTTSRGVSRPIAITPLPGVVPVIPSSPSPAITTPPTPAIPPAPSTPVNMPRRQRHFTLPVARGGRGGDAGGCGWEGCGVWEECGVWE